MSQETIAAIVAFLAIVLIAAEALGTVRRFNKNR